MISWAFWASAKGSLASTTGLIRPAATSGQTSFSSGIADGAFLGVAAAAQGGGQQRQALPQQRHEIDLGLRAFLKAILTMRPHIAGGLMLRWI